MASLPEPLGSALTPLLNYLTIPHTPLKPTTGYTLSDLSNNLRASSATSLRSHLPKGKHRDKLRYVTSLKHHDFLLIGYKEHNVVVGLLQNTPSTMVLHIAGDVVPLGDGVFPARHPLEDSFDSLFLLYFVAPKFEDAHLLLPFLYRRRKVRQLKKLIQAREGKKEKKVGRVGKVEKKKKKKKTKEKTNES